MQFNVSFHVMKLLVYKLSNASLKILCKILYVDYLTSRNNKTITLMTDKSALAFFDVRCAVTKQSKQCLVHFYSLILYHFVVHFSCYLWYGDLLWHRPRRSLPNQLVMPSWTINLADNRVYLLLGSLTCNIVKVFKIIFLLSLAESY